MFAYIGDIIVRIADFGSARVLPDDSSQLGIGMGLTGILDLKDDLEHSYGSKAGRENDSKKNEEAFTDYLGSRL